jgi:hypothetical protein
VTAQSVQPNTSAAGESPDSATPAAATTTPVLTGEMRQRIAAHRVSALIALAGLATTDQLVHVADHDDELETSTTAQAAGVLENALYELGQFPDEHWPPQSHAEFLSHLESDESWASALRRALSNDVVAPDTDAFLRACKIAHDNLESARAGKAVSRGDHNTLAFVADNLDQLRSALAAQMEGLYRDNLDAAALQDLEPEPWDAHSTRKKAIRKALEDLATERNRAVMGPLVDVLRTSLTPQEHRAAEQRYVEQITAFEAINALGLNLATTWILAHGDIDSAFAAMPDVSGAEAWMALMVAETTYLGGTYSFEDHLHSLVQLSTDLFGAMERRPQPGSEDARLLSPDDVVHTLYSAMLELRDVVSHEAVFGRDQAVRAITAAAKREYEPLLRDVMAKPPSELADDEPGVPQRALRAIHALRSSPALQKLLPKFMERLEQTLTERNELQTQLRSATWRQAEGANINPAPHTNLLLGRHKFARPRWDRLKAIALGMAPVRWGSAAALTAAGSTLAGMMYGLSKVETPTTPARPETVQVMPDPQRTEGPRIKRTPAPVELPEATDPSTRLDDPAPWVTISPNTKPPSATEVPALPLPTRTTSPAPSKPVTIPTSPVPTSPPTKPTNDPEPTTPPASSPPVSSPPITTRPVTTPVTTPPVTTPPVTTDPPTPDPVETTDRPDPVSTTREPDPVETTTKAPDPVETISDPDPEPTTTTAKPASVEPSTTEASEDVLAGLFGAARQMRELALANSEIRSPAPEPTAPLETAVQHVPAGTQRTLRPAAPSLV